ncbi:EF hand [Posidoniimonas polymericola]|uniref:EF hand n=1 Tax=Posidoniimonas polymericola TaxID=2528002 RepID=A0A5C5YUI4_9BACT|nr:hypothetical protein [Posidoniimonas polymericola]TWT78323.1 EF hand [Posidoniimonas polymericola]
MLVRSRIGDALLLSLAVALGCSGAQSRLSQPGVKRDAAKSAVDKYDTDGDGSLGAAEIAASPALQASLKRTDKDGDGRITPEELDARFAVWRNSGVALTRLAITVRQSGRPVAGASVKLVPEEFQGQAIKSASGTTDSEGVAHMKISDHPDEAGVHLGFYRIEVSKTDQAGQETLPASNNTDTKLGVEISPDDPSSSRLNLQLLD